MNHKVVGIHYALPLAKRVWFVRLTIAMPTNKYTYIYANSENV